jgi:hypothetical protein
MFDGISATRSPVRMGRKQMKCFLAVIAVASTASVRLVLVLAYPSRRWGQ